MEINSWLTPYNYTIGENKKNEFLVIHYTANDGDTAKNNCSYFSKQITDPKKKASAHYFVDEKYIWQCVLDEDIAWHVGANVYYNNCRNSNSIGIELCSRIDKKTGKYYFKNETILNAQKLTAYLMVKHNIKSDKIVRHYDTTHKICPRPFVENPALWKAYVNDLKWVDDLIYLKEVGRVTSAEDWVLKAFEEDKLLKYVFQKWAEDYRKLTSQSK